MEHCKIWTLFSALVNSMGVFSIHVIQEKISLAVRRDTKSSFLSGFPFKREETLTQGIYFLSPLRTRCMSQIILMPSI